MCHARLKDYNPEERMSWSELLQYNREFIRNQRRSTAYSWFPVFENARLTPVLLSLQDYGCLIIDARGGGNRIVQENPNAKTPGPWCEVMDRAYIRFLLPTDHPRIAMPSVRMLGMQLSSLKDIDMVYYYEYTEYEPGVIVPKTNKVRLARPVMTEEAFEEAETKAPSYKHFISTVRAKGPKSAGATTSKHRHAPTKDDLKSQKWTRCGDNELPVITEEDIEQGSQGKRGFGVELPVSKAVKPVIMSVAFKQWPPHPIGGDLAQLLEFTMLGVGMQPLFKEEDELRSKEAQHWHKVDGELTVEDAIAKRISELTLAANKD
ncbi:uncharacterized protein N0V89_002055 [Didymosphaeria variabile]|uniref:Uncharacterized protein n=1 Tax=Didymosphaeria variabile TaxID=1932322 RepID=A0A9W8XS22_9PLEO|nr:uncharacterized protein N0V89_002055 [Didymosphaeria variabile]KAJ4357479.1 hypothetical protein N0V89_002055 [Didymosphaeria variabile]